MTNLNAISMFFGKIGTTELLVILVVLLVLFGPKYLPKLGESLGNTIRGFKEGLAGDDENKDNGKTEA